MLLPHMLLEAGKTRLRRRGALVAPICERKWAFASCLLPLFWLCIAPCEMAQMLKVEFSSDGRSHGGGHARCCEDPRLVRSYG